MSAPQCGSLVPDIWWGGCCGSRPRASDASAVSWPCVTRGPALLSVSEVVAACFVGFAARVWHPRAGSGVHPSQLLSPLQLRCP